MTKCVQLVTRARIHAEKMDGEGWYVTANVLTACADRIEALQQALDVRWTELCRSEAYAAELEHRIEELEAAMHVGCQTLNHCFSRFGVCVCPRYGTIAPHSGSELHHTTTSVSPDYPDPSMA